MEDKEDLEYKKRIKILVEDVESNRKGIIDSVRAIRKRENIKDHKDLLEVMEKLKQTTISKINPKYRNEKVIIGFVAIIREFLKIDPNSPLEKAQFQEEINSAFKLLYEELRKPSLFFPNLTPNRRNWADIKDKQRIIGYINVILGEENASQFFNLYPIHRLVPIKRNAIYGATLFVLTILTFVIIMAILYNLRYWF